VAIQEFRTARDVPLDRLAMTAQLFAFIHPVGPPRELLSSVSQNIKLFETPGKPAKAREDPEESQRKGFPFISFRISSLFKGLRLTPCKKKASPVLPGPVAFAEQGSVSEYSTRLGSTELQRIVRPSDFGKKMSLLIADVRGATRHPTLDAHADAAFQRQPSADLLKVRCDKTERKPHGGNV